ncbi:MAG: hypothetical protein CVU11_13725 [Bacteroidetes bacterium HGW-Bacteroidetes-6]|jgi:predicted phosphodiesterase|nr:MAG: hypothetical protein CVU11_13725 [Bacteroidetes bacterium HGW-Bacteroidetes-6]
MRIGLISDIHEDAANLELALRKLESLCDEVVCLGDIVGFTPDFYPFRPNANRCVELIRESCKIVIAGNHDIFAIKRIPEHCGNFMFPENWYSLSASEKKEIAEKKIWLYDNEIPAELNETNTAFLRETAEFRIISTELESIFFSHFMFPDITGSETLKPCTHKAIQAHISHIASQNCQTAFCGHTHTEGLWLASISKKSRFDFLRTPINLVPFDKKIIAEQTTFFSIPAIASGNRKSGFAVYDTTTREVFSCSLS